MKNLHMKKVVMLVVAMVLAAASVAMADNVITIPDLTDVQVYQGTAPSPWGGNAWYDVIGDVGNKTTSGFNTSMIKLNFSNAGSAGMYQDLTIQIYTNYITGLEGSVPADMVLSLGGTNNYGIAMSNHGTFSAGSLYSGASFLSSVAQWAGTGDWYGGAYAPAVNPGNVPGGNNAIHITPNPALTYLTGGTLVGGVTGGLTWNTVNSDDGMYLVTVTLLGYNAVQSADLNNLSLFWGTGNCSNDGIQGGGSGSAVPLPPSVLLMGSGLLGLALLGKRQISKPE